MVFESYTGHTMKHAHGFLYFVLLWLYYQLLQFFVINSSIFFGIPWLARNVHHCDVIMDVMTCQITSLTIVYSTVHSGADHGKHQSSASLAFARRIHRWPVNSPHKWPLTRKMCPFDDIIMVVAELVHSSRIDLIHTSQNTHFHISQCSIQNRNVLLSVLNRVLWDTE